MREILRLVYPRSSLTALAGGAGLFDIDLALSEDAVSDAPLVEELDRAGVEPAARDPITSLVARFSTIAASASARAPEIYLYGAIGF